MEGKKKKGGGGWKEAEGTWRSCQIKKHVKFGSVFLLLLLPPLRTSFATGTIREQRRGELRKAGRFERRHLATLDHGLNEKDAHFFPRRVRKRRLGMRAGQEKKRKTNRAARAGSQDLPNISAWWEAKSSKKVWGFLKSRNLVLFRASIRSSGHH